MSTDPAQTITYSTNSQNTLVGSAQTAARVIPLLQSLGRLEDAVSSLTIRLDPITQHGNQQNDNPPVTTVTGRINNLGDTLQYLLDNKNYKIKFWP